MVPTRTGSAGSAGDQTRNEASKIAVMRFTGCQLHPKMMLNLPITGDLPRKDKVPVTLAPDLTRKNFVDAHSPGTGKFDSRWLHLSCFIRAT